MKLLQNIIQSVLLPFLVPVVMSSFSIQVHVKCTLFTRKDPVADLFGQFGQAIFPRPGVGIEGQIRCAVTGQGLGLLGVMPIESRDDFIFMVSA